MRRLSFGRPPSLRGRGRQVVLAVALIVVLGETVTIAIQLASNRRRGSALTTPALAQGTIDPRRAGLRIPRSFLGFSVEYQGVPSYTGAPGFPNDAFGRLVGYLAASGNGPPVLRVGGGSTDDSWWNPAHRPRPRGIVYDITPPWLEGLAQFQRRTGVPVVLGFNLAQDDPRTTLEWVRAATARLGPRAIRAFEAGNEPDYYDDRNYGRIDGRTVTARPRPYRFSQYLAELERSARALSSLHPPVGLAAPAAGGERAFVAGLPSLVARARRLGLREVTYHAYPLSGCAKNPADPDHPTVAKLLANRTSAGVASRFRALIQEARRSGLPLRLSETSSVACGGTVGVSNTMAAALWAVDYLFELASNGASGADLSSFGAGYGTAIFGYVPPKHGWVGRIFPPVYGMVLFSRATPRGARLIPVQYDRSLMARNHANVKMWSTIDPQGIIRVVVLNKDQRTAGAEVRLRIPGGGGQPASLTLLRAPALAARHGVTLAGQRFDFPFSNGRLRGKFTTTPVAVRRGAYSLQLPPATAALLTIPASRSHR